MPERVAIITSIYDGYDTLKPVCPQEGYDVDWVFVTDDPPADPLGWRVVHEPRTGMDPRRAAKHAKFLPWRYTDAEMSVWVDGSFRIISPTMIRGVERYAYPMAQFKHPWRNCLFAEAEESARLKKYLADDVIGQAEEYRAWGHPEEWGLWATGVIVRRHWDQVKTMGHAWLTENLRHTGQDQVSQPYVLRTCNVRPDCLPGTHLANQWFQYEGSERH